MRTFEKIILHCTATPPDMYVDVETIRRWHKAKGWSDCGYHYVIHRDGKIENGRPVTRTGAHTRKQNECSVGIAYVGGVNDNNEPEDNMTMMQEISFLLLVRSLRVTFGPMTIHGHNEFAAKACPSFVAREKFKFLTLEDHGVPD